MTHTQLIERLRKAEGPDREIDLIVWDLAGHPHGNYWNGTAWTDVPPYTASIDAALSLVSRVLPGWKAMLTEYPDHWIVDLCEWVPGDHVSTWGEDAAGGAKTAPLAILIAALTALQARSNTNA